MKYLLMSWIVPFVLLAGLQWGCSNLPDYLPYCPHGSEGCLCRENGTCEEGLTCSQKICSDPITENDTDPAVLTNENCAFETCDDNATCDTSGVVHACVCNEGWTGDGHICSNVDECLAQTDNCDDANGTCTDTDGSFSCGCNPRWELAADGHSCICEGGWSGVQCDVGIVYVSSASGDDAHAGGGWSDAFASIQAGIDEAAAMEAGSGLPVEVWVAQGTYYPTESDGSPADRNTSVALAAGIEVYGGFAGTESSRSERNSDPLTNGTVLSGDIDQNGVRDSGNVYHVVVGADQAVIDGFTMRDGNADGDDLERLGGGIFTETDILVRNCVIEENYAEHGGGVHNRYCSASYDDCIFRNNDALGNSGGLGSFNSQTIVMDSLFVDNSATLGGAIMDNASSSTFINITVTRNVSSGSGPALYAYDDAHPTVHNSILWGNQGGSGGEIYNSGVSTTTVSFSNVEGGYSGSGNIGALAGDDPLFGDPSQDDFNLSASSPCRDTGSNAAVLAGDELDLAGNVRIQNGTVDMGALEF